MCLVWVFTVSSLRSSSRAATVVDSPSASSCRIWRWRRVSLPRLPFGGTVGIDEALLGERRPRPPRAAARCRPCGRRRRWRRPASRRWRLALGPLAVGDDAEAGLGRCRCRIASVPHRAPTLAVRPPAHVDDRDVEVADVADELEGLLAASVVSSISKPSASSRDAEPDDRWSSTTRQRGRSLRTASDRSGSRLRPTGARSSAGARDVRS